jgi:Protein of unknown function (DUF3306)
MSEPEKFLDRWSRRKREAADASPPAEAEKPAAVPPLPDGEAKEGATEAVFDPASLPPIESITAQSDVRAFLKPGVPPELTRAALRRAWSADPAIRDFIGLIENPWDFNDPYGVPGFGPMPVGENIASLLAQAIGTPPAQSDAPQQVARVQDSSEQNSIKQADSGPARELWQDQLMQNEEPVAPEKVSIQRSEEDIASQNNSDEREDFPPSRQRGHGGALPK